MFKSVIENIFEGRKVGRYSGVTSFCIANPLAIKSVLMHAKQNIKPVLFEATSNQVNQNGGYTGMTPDMYRQCVQQIAVEIDYPVDKLLFGGDHLGPLPVCDLPAEEAMAFAKEMVRAYVMAGYEKIHLDTSMHLGDDNHQEPLSKLVIASRGAQLMNVALQAFMKYKKIHPDAEHPMFVIGSEVPPAGGQDAKAEVVEITSESHVNETMLAYKEAFNALGIIDSFKYVIGLVVQPGVEYGNHDVIHYDSLKSTELMKALNDYEKITYEGHSTDYQTRTALRNMVVDGVGIMKVGPAITMSLCEALLNLESIEKVLISDSTKCSRLSEVIDLVMSNSPGNWEKYYGGSIQDIQISRKYSLLNRMRYYLNDRDIQNSIQILLDNLQTEIIPPGMVRLYFPMQFRRLRWEQFVALDLIFDYVSVQIGDYDYATEA